MIKSLTAKIGELPPEAQARIAARTEELIAEELAIRDLRKAMAKTQVDVARKLDVGQEAVSRIEQRGDLMISTLRGYLRAIGADLELRAVFKGRPPVKLAGFSDLGRAARPAKKSPRPPASPGAKTAAARR